MRNARWLTTAGLVVATAGCVETNGYPTTSYGSGYYGQPSYYSQPSYYRQPVYYKPAPQPVVVTQTRYVPVAVPTPVRRPHRHRDSDRDGIPDRHERDRNGDGIPDRHQRRGTN